MQRYPERTMKRSMRVWGDMLRIWRLCGRAGCRRAHACRGDARACFPHNFALLPEGVRDWFAGVGEAQKNDLSFDAAMERLDALPEGEAFRAWCKAVAEP